MDWAEVDARPFLHYRQYLTYGGLGERDKQLQTFRSWRSYICTRIKINLYHLETAWNLMNHCCNMEDDYIMAILLYEASLRYLGKNNAANWHIRRVLRL